MGHLHQCAHVHICVHPRIHTYIHTYRRIRALRVGRTDRRYADGMRVDGRTAGGRLRRPHGEAPAAPPQPQRPTPHRDDRLPRRMRPVNHSATKCGMLGRRGPESGPLQIAQQGPAKRPHTIWTFGPRHTAWQEYLKRGRFGPTSSGKDPRFFMDLLSKWGNTPICRLLTQRQQPHLASPAQINVTAICCHAKQLT